MRPGMTVVPRQSTTTSARAAPVREAAPIAAMRPFSTTIASASARGDSSIPVARAPTFTSPSVGIVVLPVTTGSRSRVGATGTAAGRARRDPFRLSGGGRREPGWSPAAAGRRTRAAWSSRARPAAVPVAPTRRRDHKLAAGSSIRVQAARDHFFGGGPVVGAEHAAVHDGLRGGVEHLVLELAPSELGTDEIPDQLHELDALARARGGRLVVAL